MTAYRRPLLPAALTTTALLLAACNGAGGADDATTTTTNPPSTVTSTAAPAQETTTTEVATAAETSEPTDRAMGEPATSDQERDPVWVDPPPLVTGIRVGEHESFTRVVYDFVGEGEPGWFTGYVERPQQQGSGFDVDVEGQAYLKIDLTGTAYPFDHDHEGLDVGPVTGGGVVAQVVNTGTFEGHTLTYIGLDQQRPYSISVLQNPLRVVVDIRH